MDERLDYSSVERIPMFNASAAFTEPRVFREDSEAIPVRVGNYQYMKWGADNQMPFDVLDLIEKDETMSTCLQFTSELLYGQGLRYNSDAGPQYAGEIEDLFLDSDMQNYFLGCCMDLKYWGFCVSCFVLSKDGTKIVRLARKEAIYCRFAPIDKSGRIPYLLYGIWRKSAVNPDSLEKIPIIPPTRGALQDAVRTSRQRKFAIITRIPTADSTYYPIPPYASLFRGNWYNIKQLIGISKEAMLKHSAPIKYQVEVQREYWTRIFDERHITDLKEKEKTVSSSDTGWVPVPCQSARLSSATKVAESASSPAPQAAVMPRPRAVEGTATDRAFQRPASMDTVSVRLLPLALRTSNPTCQALSSPPARSSHATTDPASAAPRSPKPSRKRRPGVAGSSFGT